MHSDAIPRSLPGVRKETVCAHRRSSDSGSWGRGSSSRSASSWPTCGELATLTVLDIQDLGVASLAGLEHAHALVTLQADRNDIDDVTVLAGLSNLRELWFGGNQVSDISPLVGLTELRGISFWNKPVASVAPIGGMTQLTHAYIGNIAARDHHLLGDLTQLRVLNLDTSGLTNLDFLTGMTELVEFQAPDNVDLVDASA